MEHMDVWVAMILREHANRIAAHLDDSRHHAAV
jgi:hypothetical protein